MLGKQAQSVLNLRQMAKFIPQKCHYRTIRRQWTTQRNFQLGAQQRLGRVPFFFPNAEMVGTTIGIFVRVPGGQGVKRCEKFRGAVTTNLSHCRAQRLTLVSQYLPVRVPRILAAAVNGMVQAGALHGSEKAFIRPGALP